MRSRMPLSKALAALMLLASCGCDKNQGSAMRGSTVTVKGKVTYQGKPLTKGNITLEPVDRGREAHGGIQPDGTFVLSTFQENDGAVPGVHRVSITEAGKAVPRKFQHTSSSQVEIEVVEGKTEYSIDLK